MAGKTKAKTKTRSSSKTDQKQDFNYNGEIKLLRERGPERVYLLYGPEEFLRERYLEQLRKTCVPEENEFSLRRLNGPAVDLNALAEAVNALPFFTERSFVEVREFDLNKCRDAAWQTLEGIVSDVPKWCTLVFVLASDYTPDGRLSAVKGLKKVGHTIVFPEQTPAVLKDWVCSHVRASGKTILPEDAEYLIFLSGTRMLRLLQEIEKITAYTEDDTVTRVEIDAVTDRLPEADVFAITDQLAQRRFDAAAATLSDLLRDKDNHPIFLTSLIGQQFRRLYAVKAGQAAGRSRTEIMELSGSRMGFVYDKLTAAAKGFTMAQLGKLVDLCAEYDFKMKSTGLDPETLIRELFLRIGVETG